MEVVGYRWSPTYISILFASHVTVRIQRCTVCLRASGHSWPAESRPWPLVQSLQIWKKKWFFKKRRKKVPACIHVTTPNFRTRQLQVLTWQPAHLWQVEMTPSTTLQAWKGRTVTRPRLKRIQRCLKKKSMKRMLARLTQPRLIGRPLQWDIL